MLLVEIMKADNSIKSHLTSNEDINEDFFKIQNSSNSPYNVLTKNHEQNSQENKLKKLRKKVDTKLKKSS